MLIKGFDCYHVSSNGEVTNTRTGRVLKYDLSSGGYRRVTLSQDGNLKRVFVHRLVAQHYIPNPYNYPHVNHKDGDRLNNEKDNLEWCTPSQNIQHGWDRDSERVPHNKKYSDSYIVQIRSELGNTKEAARQLGIHTSTVQRAVIRERERATTIPKGSTLKRVEAVSTER